MIQFIESGMAVVAMAAAMLGLMEMGRRFGQRRLREDPTGANSGVGTLEGAVFGLMGLLLAFTFSGASSRFDARRELILKESNVIGTALLRLDLLPTAVRQEMRADLARYVDLRIAATHDGATRADEAVTAVQQRLWSRAVAAVGDSGDRGDAQLVLPALNDMFDVASARYVATQAHPPTVVFALLIALALVCALLAGYGLAASKRRSWLHILCFAGSLLLAIYVILDIEFPRRGLIRVDRYDQLLVDLRASLK